MSGTYRPVLGLVTYVLLCLLLGDLSHVLAGRNYYDVLGVPKDASKRQIKKAFRKASMEKHPDKSDSPNAEAEFAEISNAYQVLSDDEARKKYDRFGEEGLKGGPGGGGGFHFQNHFDVFSQFFGGGGGPGGGGGSFKFQFGGPGGGGQRQQRFQQQPQKKEELYTSETPDIEILTDDNFDSIATANENDIWLIQFYQEGCGRPCHDIADAYKKAANDLRGQVRMGVVDAKNGGQGLTRRFSVLSTPTILLLPYGDAGEAKLANVRTFDGPRTAKGITNFAMQNIPSFVTKLTEANLQQFLDEAKTKVVLLFTERRVVPPMFSSLSKDFKDALDFGAVLANAAPVLAKRFEGVSDLPALLVLDRSHGASKSEDLFTGAVTYMEIRRWLFSHYRTMEKKREASSQDRAISLNPQTVDATCSAESKKLCLITGFSGVSATSELKRVQQSLLAKYAMDNKFVVAELAKDVHSQFWESFGHSGEHTMVVWNRRRGKYVVYDGELNLESVSSFLDNLLGGNLRWTRFTKGIVPVWGHDEL